jgi:hypothetical protein
MSFFDELTSARNITDEYRFDCNNKVIFAAGVRLQLAILAAMTANLRAELPKRKAKPKLYDGLTREEIENLFMKQEQCGYSDKIGTIKMARERTGLGLFEAKKLVENWMYGNYGIMSGKLPGTAEHFFLKYKRNSPQPLNEPAYNS